MILDHFERDIPKLDVVDLGYPPQQTEGLGPRHPLLTHKDAYRYPNRRACLQCPSKIHDLAL